MFIRARNLFANNLSYFIWLNYGANAAESKRGAPHPQKNSAALTEDGAIRSISDFLKCVRRAVIRLKRFQPTSGLRSS